MFYISKYIFLHDDFRNLTSEYQRYKKHFMAKTPGMYLGTKEGSFWSVCVDVGDKQELRRAEG